MTSLSKRIVQSKKRVEQTRRNFAAEVALLCHEHGEDCGLLRMYRDLAPTIRGAKPREQFLADVKEHFAEHASLSSRPRGAIVTEGHETFSDDVPFEAPPRRMTLVELLLGGQGLLPPAEDFLNG